LVQQSPKLSSSAPEQEQDDISSLSSGSFTTLGPLNLHHLRKKIFIYDALPI
jgi:hypothetical protein